MENHEHMITIDNTCVIMIIIEGAASNTQCFVESDDMNGKLPTTQHNSNQKHTFDAIGFKLNLKIFCHLQLEFTFTQMCPQF